jgi:hypothetical protein
MESNENEVGERDDNGEKKSFSSIKYTGDENGQVIEILKDNEDVCPEIVDADEQAEER